MDIDDLEPRASKGAGQELGNRDLEPLSIEALEDYIAALKAEIVRAESAIAAKQAARAGAEAFFKSNA